MTSLSPSTSSLSSDDMASSLTGGQRTSPTNSLNSDHALPVPEAKLHCVLCSETFRSPKVLQCLHSFCAPCLEKLVIHEGLDRISCPECHLLTKLPLNGVSGLLPDYGMIRLLNLTNSAGNGFGLDRLCTSCKGNEKLAQAQCMDCVNLLCGNCMLAHQLMHCFNRHRVYPLNNNGFASAAGKGGSSGVTLCPIHGGDRLDMFCETCAVPICETCMLMDHPKNQHHIVGVAEVGAREVAALVQLKERAHAKTDELLNLSGENGAARFTASYHAAQAAIEDTLQFHIQVLKERRDELLQNLESVYEERQAGCSLIQERSIEASRRLNSISQFMDRLMAYGSEAEILLFKRPLTHLMENVLMGLSDSLFGWTGDVQFVTNYQAIQSGVQQSYGFIEKKDRQSNRMNGTQRSLPSMGGEPAALAGFPFPTNTASSMPVNGAPFDRVLPVANAVKRTSPQSVFPYSNSVDPMLGLYDKWMDSPNHNDYFANTSLDTVIDEPLMNGKSFPGMNGPVGSRQTVRRMKMAYVAKFGDFGTGDGQFSEPSGVAVNAQRDILVADTNNHRVQIFDQEGRFKFAFGECGKRDGQMLYPNRVAVARNGDIVVTERSPTHQIQVYNQYGAFVRKFGADILQHPRGITVDSRGRVIVVECKVMRVVIFEASGRIYNKFACSQHLEFPNGVATNDNEEIFISDNRAHSVKVFNYHGIFLRQIGGEGVTNFPIGVCITERGHVVVADNHNNFNLTIFRQDGTLLSAYESRVKHAQCFDVTLMDEGSVVLASKDYKVYVYRFANVSGAPFAADTGSMKQSLSGNSLAGGLRNGGNIMPDFHMKMAKLACVGHGDFLGEPRL